MSSDVYERLARKLDALPNGYPRTESGIELKVLQKIFTEEEAEIACSLKLLPQMPEQIAENLGRDAEGMADMLENMVKRGEINGVGPAGARMYHLIPFIIGIYEFQVQRIDREFAELMEQYIEEGFFEGIGQTQPAFMHAIPIEQAVDAQLEVHPFESVREIMDKSKVFITRDCVCRKEKEALDTPCSKPILNCISMSTNENAFDIDYGGKKVDRAEAERIMKEAEDAGLVHSTMNMDDETVHFCNCCPCCCGLMRGVKNHNAPGMVAKSNYWASIDPDTCIACGTCADERCPMDAINDEGDYYEVNRERCIGCGVCVPTCPSDSITLVRKPEDQCIKAPDDMVQWMMQKSMSTGKPLDEFM